MRNTILVAFALWTAACGSEIPGSMSGNNGRADAVQQGDCPFAPKETGYSPACDRSVYDVLTSEVVRWEGDDATIVERAVALFQHETGQNPVGLTIEQIELDIGWIVEIGGEGEESSWKYVFDAEGDLLVANDTTEFPTSHWYCGEPEAEPMPPPSGECVTDWIALIPHETAKEVETSDESHWATEQGQIAYLEYFDLGPETEVTLSAAVWTVENPFGDGIAEEVARVVAKAEGQESAAFLISRESHLLFTNVTTGDGTEVRYGCPPDFGFFE